MNSSPFIRDAERGTVAIFITSGHVDQSGRRSFALGEAMTPDDWREFKRQGDEAFLPILVRQAVEEWRDEVVDVPIELTAAGRWQSVFQHVADILEERAA